MEIRKNAVAGTLESSDAMVTVEPNGQGQGIDFGHSIRNTVIKTLDNLGIKDVRIRIIDKGALDCTLKARVECAVFRAAGQMENLPWGGAIK